MEEVATVKSSAVGVVRRDPVMDMRTLDRKASISGVPDQPGFSS